MLQDPNANLQLDQAPDPWFAQFDPANASASSPYPNTGINGGATPIATNPTAPAAQPGFQLPDSSLHLHGSAPAPTGGSQITMQSFSQAWESSPYPGTVDGLKAFMAAHPEYAAAGITLGGSKGDKVYGPGGSYWGDAVIAAGEGGRGKSRLTGDTGVGGGTTGNTLSGLGYGFGSSMAPWNEQFSAPTADQALNTQGMQFALSENNRMLQNSAAAKGTLLNGRFQQALGASNIQNALQGYGDVYNRSMGEYGLRRENFYNNQDRPFDKNYRLATLGKPA